MQKYFRVPGRLALKLTELGLSLATVLHRAGLPRDLFAQTRVLVTTQELFALWRSIETASDDPLIGVTTPKVKNRTLVRRKTRNE